MKFRCQHLDALNLPTFSDHSSLYYLEEKKKEGKERRGKERKRKEEREKGAILSLMARAFMQRANVYLSPYATIAGFPVLGCWGCE